MTFPDDHIQLINADQYNKEELVVRKRYLANRKFFLPFICGVTIGIVFAKLLASYEKSEYLFYDERIIIRSTQLIEDERIRKSSDKQHVANMSLADDLFKEIRILCWVMTNSTNHDTKAQAVKETWGRRCHQLIFMSDEVDKELGSIDLNVGYGRDVLWGKTKEAFKYVYNHHFNDADWFLKADDDTYVILENLRYMLHAYDKEDPIYFGCKFKEYVEQGYMSGGAGYVLSKEAVRRFVDIGLEDETKCRPDNGGAEDVETGLCLQAVGVVAGDSRDSSGRRRFFPLGIEDHYMNLKRDDTFWYAQYSFYNIPQGLDCCSDLPISFHYVEPYEMNLLDHLIYQVKPFGIVNEMEKLPAKFQLSVYMFDDRIPDESETIDDFTENK